ncbi:MAG TPA: SusC/RagA family TonB-linked outer membrane protein [Gemmatimonadaceae bacterium]|nr:SusC/RagA family TonB-linked outer membrane protein [Gemmatimonadaceae bacterium]
MRTCRVLSYAALLSVLCSPAALAQRAIHGTVVDIESNAPILSVRVAVKGVPIGAYTDAAGKFTINNAPAGALTLDVRRIGYAAKSVALGADQNEITIQLKADVLQLSQMVITGQATQVSKANLANDVGTVGAEDLTHTHAQTLDDALTGKIAGAMVSSNSGAPGGGMQIQMRGVTSIFGNSEPLYVVDGLPISNTTINNGLNALTQSAGGMGQSNQDNGVNRIADLNPSDIASIEILKGPSAAAIYGSEAANGVVVITTKRGQAGKPHFSVTQRVGTNRLAHTIPLRRFTLAGAEAFVNGAIDTATLAQWFQDNGGYHDFQNEVYGDKSLSYETDLSVSGGSENTQYFLSGLESHDNGTMKNTGYDKQSLRGNLTQMFGSKLQLQVNTNLVHSLTKRGVSNNDNVNVSPYIVFSATPTFFDFQPVNGVYPVNPFLSNGSNPLQTIALVRTPEDVYRFLGSVNATYTVFTAGPQSLQAVLDLGIDHYAYTSNLYSPPQLYWEPADGLDGTATAENASETRAPIALTLKHQYLNGDNGFSATTSLGVRRGYDDLSQTNVVTQNLLGSQSNIDRGSAVNVFENRQSTRTLALFGQEEMLLMDQKLYVSAGLLGQRSTNNAFVNRMYYFPKFAASYQLPTFGAFNQFKIRAAFGETGNEPNYGDKFTSIASGTNDQQIAGALVGTVADPNLHPEREREIEGGVDAGLFNSRLSFSLTGYQKDNTDLLLKAALAPSTGFATRIFNGGSIRNRGAEVSVSGFPLQMKDFTWNARVTFSRNEGTVTNLPVPAFEAPNAFAAIFGEGFIQQGHSPSQLVGIDSAGNLVQMGDALPKYVMTFSSDFAIGPVHLYGLVDWHHGGNAVNLTQALYDLNGTAGDTAAAAIRANDFFSGITGYIQPAGFVKLREVTLSYELPPSLVHSMLGTAATSVRLEASGRNLYTWTKYGGLDPEVSNFGNQNINRGQDVAPYPASRSFFFTVGVDF